MAEIFIIIFFDSFSILDDVYFPNSMQQMLEIEILRDLVQNFTLFQKVLMTAWSWVSIPDFGSVVP